MKHLNHNHIFCLIKFGKTEYLKKLLEEGELFFNTSENYNSLQDTEEETGDKYEGAEWIENAYVNSIDVSHPTYGKFELTPAKDKLFKFCQFNYYFLSHSLYAITSNIFEKENTFTIDRRNTEFKDANSALLITKPYKFINRVITEIKRQKINYGAGLVEYKDFEKEGKLDVGAFVKKKEHEHQNEFRIIIENIDNTTKKISIGSIEQFAHLVSAESIIETIWEANKD